MVVCCSEEFSMVIAAGLFVHLCGCNANGASFEMMDQQSCNVFLGEINIDILSCNVAAAVAAAAAELVCASAQLLLPLKQS